MGTCKPCCPFPLVLFSYTRHTHLLLYKICNQNGQEPKEYLFDGRIQHRNEIKLSAQQNINLEVFLSSSSKDDISQGHTLHTSYIDDNTHKSFENQYKQTWKRKTSSGKIFRRIKRKKLFSMTACDSWEFSSFENPEEFTEIIWFPQYPSSIMAIIIIIRPHIV